MHFVGTFDVSQIFVDHVVSMESKLNVMPGFVQMFVSKSPRPKCTIPYEIWGSVNWDVFQYKKGIYKI